MSVVYSEESPNGKLYAEVSNEGRAEGSKYTVVNVYEKNTNLDFGWIPTIDDVNAVTLVSASTLEKELNIKNGGNVEAAKLIGAEIAKRAKKAKIEEVVFDRGGYLYHGRVKALAEAARENGLEF